MSKVQKKRRAGASARSEYGTGRSHAAGAPVSQPARRKGRRRRRGGNNILLYLLILIFMVTTTVILTTTVFFKIKSISVTGADRYNSRDVIVSSGILLEENMFRLKDQEIKEKLIAEYSYIQSVKIRRRMPDTIVLEITEATPVGAIDAGTGYTLIGSDGRILECNTPVIPEGMPVIVGIGQELPQQGGYLNQEDSQSVKRLHTLMGAAQETGFSYADVIDLSDSYNLKVYYQDLFEIIFGTDANLPYKMEMVQRIIEEQSLLTTFKGTIDASYDGEVRTRPGNVTVPSYQSGDTGDDASTSPQLEESAP